MPSWLFLFLLSIQLTFSLRTTFENTLLFTVTGPLHHSNQLLPLEIYENENIDGIYIQLLWSVIEPIENVYDWSTLDSQINIINYANVNRTNNLLISLALLGGGNSPTWIINKVPSYNFTVSPHGTGTICHNITIPQPWNLYLINQYKKLLYNLADHLKFMNVSLKIIKISFINQVTEELRLPSSDKPIYRDGCTISNATKIWENTGYSPKLIIKTWIQIAEYTNKLFPNSIISLEILQNGAFPPIESHIDITEEIINYGINNFSNFSVQWDGLNTVSTAQIVINAGKKGAIVGWQSNLFFGLEYGAGCYGDTLRTAVICNQTGYTDLLNFGVRHMGKFLELWSVDVINFL